MRHLPWWQDHSLVDACVFVTCLQIGCTRLADIVQGEADLGTASLDGEGVETYINTVILPMYKDSGKLKG